MKGKDGKYYSGLIRDLGLDGLEEKTWDSPEVRALLEDAWEKEHHSAQEGGFDREVLLQSVLRKMESPGHKTAKRSATVFFRKYVAVLVLGLVLATGALYFGIIRPMNGGNGQWIELAGSDDTGTIYELPDGTTVQLNEATSLSYPERFSRNNRAVILSGEALFDVEGNDRRPFIVRTSDVRIEVLGTRFNVRSYPESDIIQTILVSGKLRISRENPTTGKTQSVVLTPNHKATYYKGKERFIMDRLDAGNAILWTSGAVSFDNERFESVIRMLERRYDLQIRIEDEQLKDLRITLRIDDEPVEEMLTILSRTLSLEYTRKGNQVVFRAEEDTPPIRQSALNDQHL